jgi:hypothetical protein
MLMRMRTRNRERETLPATLQEVRRTKEGVEGESGSEEHEMETLLGNPKLVKETLEYVEKTGSV